MRTLSPGQGWMARAEAQQAPVVQPAGRRPPVSHHMDLGSMVPEAMGFSPSLPDREFHRGWSRAPRLELAIPSQRAAPGMYTPPPYAARPHAPHVADGPTSQTTTSRATTAGSYRTYLSTPPQSQRGSRASTPGRATPPPSSRRLGSYSTTSRDVGLGAPAPSGLRSHWDSQALPFDTADSYKREVGGVLPGYAGHVPNAHRHCGNSHVGGVATSPSVNTRPPSQRAQLGHGATVTRMDRRAASEIAGPQAEHVASTSIVGYQGHLPGAETGAFGTSNWKGTLNATTPPASSRYRSEWEPPAWAQRPSPPRMASLGTCA